MVHVAAEMLRNCRVTSMVPAAPSVPSTDRARSAARHLAGAPAPVVVVAAGTTVVVVDDAAVVVDVVECAEGCVAEQAASASPADSAAAALEAIRATGAGLRS